MKAASFGIYQRVHKMSYNDFCFFITHVYKAAYEEGLRDGEAEYGAGEVYDEDRLKKLLISVPGIGEKRANRIINKFMEDWIREQKSETEKSN